MDVNSILTAVSISTCLSFLITLIAKLYITNSFKLYIEKNLNEFKTNQEIRKVLIIHRKLKIYPKLCKLINTTHDIAENIYQNDNYPYNVT